MHDTREHRSHPYLNDREDDDALSIVLWNTNASFPVSKLIESESDGLPKTAIKNKSKRDNGDSIASKQSQPIPDMEALSPFAEWLLSLKPSALEGGYQSEHTDMARDISGGALKQESVEPGKKKKKKKKKKKETHLKEENTHSELPVLDKNIVSDTLAELIASQGHIEEAISMYRKLVNHHPEKAAYYVRRISELRQGKT